MRWILLLISALTLRAQFPVARLTTIFPPGAQPGTTVEVAATGGDLDDPSELRFSHAGITGALKEGQRFTVKVGADVPPGLYEVRVVGRFGATNPRVFVVGDRPEIPDSGANKSAGAAQAIDVGMVVNGRSAANEADYFKFKARQSQRILLECLGKRIHSRMEPVMTIYTAAGRELDRARVGGLLDFVAPEDGEFVLKLHDAQFRGGDEFAYRLALRGGPWIDFARPAAIEPGTKAKVTLFGRNLPGGQPTGLKVDGKSLEQIETEVEAPKDGAAHLLATRPADAAVEAFEFRLPSADGASNPILLSLGSAKVVVENDANDRSAEAMKVSIPCEVQGSFYPRGDVDWFEFEAEKGAIYWIEAFSQRLGLNTDPFVVVQRVTKNDKGEEKVSDTQEMYDTDANPGGVMFNTTTRDPALRVDAKEGGIYRVQARDLFSETISDPRRIYRLSFRKESSDFRLIAYSPAPPPLNKDSKEAHPWGAFLRRGDSVPIQVLALRRDGFGGEIEISAEGLPSGVRAEPARMINGASSASLILFAAEDAGAWTGPIRIVGRARLGDREIVRTARSGTLLWSLGDYNNEAVQSHLRQELLLCVSGAEVAPLALRSEKPVEAAAGAKVSAPLSILRRGEFKNGLKFRTLFDPAKEFEVDGNATNAMCEIDLSQVKLTPGTHWLPVLATSPGRYRRITPEEAAEFEEEIKKLKESLPGITDAPKKEAVNNQIKALELRLQFKDLTATVYGAFAVTVLPEAQKTP